ncbi:MAG: response regulator [Gemmatimonadota bacterium]|nr:response regulator [Gemmatimonadota bacterium]
MTAHAPGGPRRPWLPGFRSQRATILLVDDDDRARHAVTRALKAEGFRVVEARGGNHALRMCEWVVGQVDVLITEVAIPEPNGVAIAEAVSALWPKVAVLFMSDGVVAAVTQYRGAPKVRRVLRRPLAVEDLVERARRALVAR